MEQWIWMSIVYQGKCCRLQGPRSKFSSGGAKEECVKENFWGGGRRGGHACGFLFNFSKVTENANNDKTIDFFSTSSVMLLLGLKIHHH